MLKRQIIIYKDGRKLDHIIYTDNSSPTIIYPKRDNIKHAFLTTFKYKITLKSNETVALIRFGDKKVLMPKNIEVHPQTTLDDVEVINVRKNTKSKIKKYTFKSSSSDAVYTVKEIEGKLTCDCSGFWRVKDKSKGCKHVQQVRKDKKL